MMVENSDTFNEREWDTVFVVSIWYKHWYEMFFDIRKNETENVLFFLILNCECIITVIINYGNKHDD